MPKLLQIDSCLGILSTGRITESIAALATVKGWDCYIAHGARCIGETRQTHYQITKKFDEYVHYAQSLLFDSHGLHSTAATRRLVKWIDSIKPDVINLHCIHGYHLNYKVLFEYLNAHDIPVVWTFHDCWAFTGHCAYFTSIQCNKWKEGGCYNCPLKRDYPMSIVDRSARNYSIKKELFKRNKQLHIVTVSKWLEQVTRESFFSNADIRTIYNGVDTDIFKPKANIKHVLRKYALDDVQYVVGVATAWSERKGLSDYWRLSSLMSQEVKIVLVGLDDKLCKEAANYGIVGIPRTDNVDELVALYNGASIVMNLSYEETFGLTTIEGFACGTPSIVYNATASPELVTPETGVVCAPGDIDGVARAIEVILLKGKGYYFKACRERALEKYNKDDRFQEYINLYENLIKK